jgi:menaquinone-specific isochorismate synthase
MGTVLENLRAAPGKDGASGAGRAEALEAAVTAAAGRLASIGHGRLASFAFPLPGPRCAPEAPPGGDSLWFSPDGRSSFHGSASAVRFAGDAAGSFAAEREHWCVSGAEHAMPVAFFTAPPATARGTLSLRVPQVLARSSPEGTVLVLTARRDETPVQGIARAWREEAARLLSPAAEARAGRILGATSAPDAAEWRRRVQAAVAAIGADEIVKLVLSRRVAVRMSDRIDATALARRLAGLHPGCHVFSLPYGDGHVVAASPEPLAVKRGSRMTSHALAGTAKRHGAADDDAHAAEALRASPKERQEHAVVVDSIAARMRTFCTRVEHSAAPTVRQLRFVQHLWTPVTGELREGIGLLDAVARLHPTPAVLGEPPQAARDWLERLDERRDGLYSGVAGWIDLAGDGDAAVVLRAAQVEDRSAVLWAGAGIMADSDPDAEMAETELKLATMLEVLEAR